MKRFLKVLAALVFLFNFNQAIAVPEEITEVVDTPVEMEQVEDAVSAEVSFDWLDINAEKRNEYINDYRLLIFDNGSDGVFFDKDEFNATFKPYLKDKNFKHHYFYVNNGITEDEEAKYCAFYYKKSTLLIYAIQYKSNPRQAFYYSAFGKMYYIDLMSENYPNFPYYSLQYDRKGRLSSAIYFVSADLQYMFGPDKEFQGVWYKDKMYDKTGKQTLTRTNW